MSDPVARAGARTGARSDHGAVDADNPWLGLASFREADRGLFFGRESETEELFRLVQRERLTVLFGLSGLGKTSLLQAGLFPRLRDENVLPVAIRLEHSAEAVGYADQIAGALARSCENAGAEMAARRPGETLWELFHRQGNEIWSARNRPLVPLLVFDQFEEIFTLGAGAPGRQELVAILASLAEGYPPPAVKARLDANPAEAKQFAFGRHPYKLMLSLREDFLPDLEGLRDRIRTIGNNRMRVCRMTGANALRVVLLPGRGLVEPEVAERIVRFVAGEEPGDDPSDDPKTQPAALAELEIEPALLSIVCRELNNKRRARGEAQITADLLEGSRTEILSGLYERSLEGLDPAVRTFIEERLLTVSGFRDSVALENALATAGVTREAVDRLTQRRLLRIEDQGGGQRLELTHDVLTGVVRQSRDARRQQEAEVRAEEVRREAEARERTIRRELRRSRQMLLLVAVLLLGVVVFSILAYLGSLKVKQTLAASDVERASNLEHERSQEALACLGHALKLDPDSLPARSLLLDLLLDRSWLLPVRQLDYPQSEEIEIAQDGRTYTVLTRSGGVQVYDLDTLRPLGSKVRDTRKILGIDTSDDGTRLVTSTDTAVRVWEARTGKPVGGPISTTEGEVNCLDADCRLMAQEAGASVRFLDTATGKAVGPPVASASFPSRQSPDGVRIATVEPAGTVLVRDLRTGEVLGPPMPHAGQVRNARFSSDGRLIAVTLVGTVQLWDGATHARLSRLSHEQPLDLARFTADGTLLLTHSSDGTTRLWDAASGKLRSSFTLAGDWRSHSLSRDGRQLLTVTEDRTARLWDTQTGRQVAEPVRDVSSARFRASDPRQVVTASEDGMVRILTTTVPSRSLLVGTPTDTFAAAALSSDTRFAAAVESGALGVWDITQSKLAGPSLPGLQGVRNVRFVAGDRLLAVVQNDRAFTWDFRAGRIQGQVRLTAWPNMTSISPDGTKAVVAISPTFPPDLQVVDLATGKPLTRVLVDRARWQGPVPFSPDGTKLLIAPTATSIRVVSIRRGVPQPTLAPHGGRLLAAVFSPDSRGVLTVADDRAVRLWDAATGKLLGSVVSPHGVASASFTPDGRSVLTIAEDTRVRLWNIATRKPRGEPLLTPSALSAQLAPDGHRILVLSDDTARLWDSVTGRPLGDPISPGGRIQDARFSPGGHRLFVISEESLSVNDVPMSTGDDADLLILWASAVGGYELDDGIMTAIPDPVARLEDLRRQTVGAPLGQPATPSLIRWFLTDPAHRAPSPLAP